MKPVLKNYLAFALLLAVAVTGCKKGTDGSSTAGNFNKSASAFTDTGAPSATATLPNIIPSGFTFTPNTTYLIDGPTFVPAGVTLTIPAGTFIKGKKTSTGGKPSFLLVTKGARLIANGTQANPIRFTSDQPACSRAAGDWGGVVILGNGKTNVATTTVIEGIDATMVPAPLTYPTAIQYGGDDEADAANASSLQYVRIEFAGDILEANNELNGLTLGGVGSATTLNNIQVSWGADDAFEFFGGSVNAKYLISYGNNDDDFDFDQGYQGSIQFALGVKLACATGYSSNPNGIECNNITSPVTTVNSRITHPILSNFTIIGHDATSGPTAGVGAMFRAGTEFTFVNSLVGGFATGINHSASSVTFTFTHNGIHGFTAATNPATGGSEIERQAGGDTNNFLALADPFNLSCACPNSTSIPDFRFVTFPATGPAVPPVNPVTPTFPAVTHPGGALTAFTAVGYRGAFDDDSAPRWDLGTYWTSYNPQGNPN